MPINKVDNKSIADNAVVVADFVNATISNDKLVNTSITIGGKSVSLGSSVTTQDVQWQSVQTSSFAATVGYGYFINTTSAAITMTLPASPTAGNYIAFVDYAGTFATNNLTIARNGNTIQGISANSILSTNKAAGLLVYVDATVGWTFVEQNNVSSLSQPLFITATGGTVTTSGNFKIHTFTGDGSFVVSCAGNPVGSASVDYLVVAGGGSGGGNQGESGGAGGGGAGGYRTTFPSPGCNAGSFSVTATTFPITVGGGGTATSPGIAGKGTDGSPSIFSTITSTGGGAAGGYSLSPAPATGRAGNSGGSGGGGAGCSSPFAGGTGNTPPVSPPQGNNGGTGTAAPTYGGGGGGGSSVVGQDSGPAKAGDGGTGLANSITGTSVTRAGGGGGGSYDYNPGGQPAGAGGPGGGGAGGTGANVGVAGTTNTGGGGGGAGGRTPNAGTGRVGGNGGKGIVVIRYKFQ